VRGWWKQWIGPHPNPSPNVRGGAFAFQVGASTGNYASMSSPLPDLGDLDRESGERANLASTPSRLPASIPILSLTSISKRFGPVLANDDISLTLRAGEIHAVLGENGAGKTTLLNILSGMYQPDSGTIAINGRKTTINSPADALAKGIGTVYQHFTLVPNLSVTENLLLGTDTGFVLDLQSAERRVETMLGEVGLAISPRTEIRHLSLGQRQRVEIIKVLARGSRVLLLDEPTSVLSPVEVEGLFAILRRLRADGVAVVLITHKLEEALAISDRVTILRAGRNVGELGPDEVIGTDRAAITARIVTMMFGKDERRQAHEAARRQGGKAAREDEVVLSLKGVTARGDRGESVVRGLSLDLRAGEVFGIAGVDGNGQKELGEVIAGQRQVEAGEVVRGSRVLTNSGTKAALRAGIGYVTDDRLGEGCVPGMSVAENAVLKMVRRSPFSNGIWLNRSAIEAEARHLVTAFNVRTPDTATPITRLSGGNIQKLLLARELAMNPEVLVCNNPTYGLDFQTTRFVLSTLRAHADKGKTVLLISSELDDLLAISDRIGVIANGQIAAVLPRHEATIEVLGRLMIEGGGSGPPSPPILGGDEDATRSSPPNIGGPQ
jgi:ABC-type uncharacterized transport system ATPase subunit